jgi:hypothetical protein
MYRLVVFGVQSVSDFPLGTYVLIDSNQLMGSSLETLVDNVTSVEGEIHFKQLRKVFPSSNL